MLLLTWKGPSLIGMAESISAVRDTIISDKPLDRWGCAWCQSEYASWPSSLTVQFHATFVRIVQTSLQMQGALHGVQFVSSPRDMTSLRWAFRRYSSSGPSRKFISGIIETAVDALARWLCWVWRQSCISYYWPHRRWGGGLLNAAVVWLCAGRAQIFILSS